MTTDTVHRCVMSPVDDGVDQCVDCGLTVRTRHVESLGRLPDCDVCSSAPGRYILAAGSEPVCDGCATDIIGGPS